MPEQDHALTLRPGWVTGMLVVAALLFTIANVVAQIFRYVLGWETAYLVIDRFDLNGEANFPTLFAVLMLVLAALLFAVIGAASRRAQQPYARHWTALAILCGYLAIDEFAQVHEGISAALAYTAGISDERRFYLWLLPFALLAVLIAISLLRFFFQLSHADQRRFALAGGLYLGGALGLEAVAALHATAGGLNTFGHAVIFTLEELAEMLGLAALIYALLCHLGERGHGLHLLFAPPAPTP